MSDSIRVVCRLRPLNKIEIANNGEECVNYSDKDITIHVGAEDNKYSFAFDKIFGPTTHQFMIYQEVAIPIIKSVISGFNGTIFAYGQTGGGKTWTMEGPNHHDAEFRGLIPRTIDGLFEKIAECDENMEFLIKCSYIEIYNEKLFDLLDRNSLQYTASKARLQIKEDRQRGVFIQNCTQICVSTSDQMLKTMDSGAQNRKVAFTGMNQRSSRSHSLFIIHLYQKNLKKDSTKQSKLYFVDLAGSEKVSKTGVQGQQLEEAKNINKSLSSLGNVINALTSQKKEHVPYRDSKLTRILQESLGGNSKTTLIINCSMCTYNDKQTLSTLRFGNRAKSIKNKPKMNEQKSVKQLLVLLDAANKTIASLKREVKGQYAPKEEIKEEDQRDLLINDLKVQLQAIRKGEEEHTKQMELRIKQLMIQLNNEKDENQKINNKWSRIFMQLSKKLNILNKMIGRTYVDLQYCQNNIIMKETEEKVQETSTIAHTLDSLQEYQQFYQQQVKGIIDELIEEEKSSEYIDNFTQENILSSEKKKSKIMMSQPTLYPQTPINEIQKESEALQMSCIVQKSMNEEHSYSDKISQQSFSQIQTILESLETKQSHKQMIEEMSANIKSIKKQNEQLMKECQKHQQQMEEMAQKLEEKYEDKIIDLDERVHQYKNIIHQKDIEFTKKFEEVQKYKNKISEEKVNNERLKKIIEANGNMKMISDMENKLRSLASERQKIFNELYHLREELDEAEMTIREKDQHIGSLKSVMKELSKNPTPTYSSTQIEKTYNTQVYGTENPNIIHTIKGKKQSKKSALRKKTNLTGNTEVQTDKEKKKILPFFKTFFS